MKGGLQLTMENYENDDCEDCCEIFNEDEIVSVEDRRNEIIEMMTGGVEDEE